MISFTPKEKADSLKSTKPASKNHYYGSPITISASSPREVSSLGLETNRLPSSFKLQRSAYVNKNDGPIDPQEPNPNVHLVSPRTFKKVTLDHMGNGRVRNKKVVHSTSYPSLYVTKQHPKNLQSTQVTYSNTVNCNLPEIVISKADNKDERHIVEDEYARRYSEKSPGHKFLQIPKSSTKMKRKSHIFNSTVSHSSQINKQTQGGPKSLNQIWNGVLHGPGYLRSQTQSQLKKSTSTLAAKTSNRKPVSEDLNGTFSSAASTTSTTSSIKLSKQMVRSSQDRILAVPSHNRDECMQAVPLHDRDVRTQAVPLNDRDVRTQAVPLHDRDVRTQGVSLHDRDVRTQAVPLHDRDVRTQAVPLNDRDVRTQAVPLHDRDVRTQAVPLLDRDVRTQAVRLHDKDVRTQAVSLHGRDVHTQAVPILDRDVRTQAVPLLDRDTRTQTVSLLDRDVRTQAVPLIDRDDHSERHELAMKMSLPCRIGCCYCVYSTILGPVKVFINRADRPKKEPFLSHIKDGRGRLVIPVSKKDDLRGLVYDKKSFSLHPPGPGQRPLFKDFPNAKHKGPQ